MAKKKKSKGMPDKMKKEYDEKAKGRSGKDNAEEEEMGEMPSIMIMIGKGRKGKKHKKMPPIDEECEE